VVRKPGFTLVRKNLPQNGGVDEEECSGKERVEWKTRQWINTGTAEKRREGKKRPSGGVHKALDDQS